MSAVTDARYREASLTAFRRVLLSWLTALPQGGWDGTVTDLEQELTTAARRERVPPSLPRGSGLGRRIASEQSFLERSGYAVAFTRTNRERRMRFARA